MALYRRVRDFVSTSYVREIDALELQDRALRGMIESLDPYSRYYDHTEVAGLSRETTGVYPGIGVAFAPIEPPGQILFPLPNSPAEDAGLSVGDRIVSANGRDLVDLSLEELGEVIRKAAREGQELLLEVESRRGGRRSLRVKPDEVVDPTVRHARLLEGDPAVGYLAITSFSRLTTTEFDEAVRSLGGTQLAGLVVDVRGNLGGVLDTAVEIANRFVSEGVLVTHEGREETVTFEADSREAHLAGLPLVVLVDGESASASEVFAAALQEHRAAVVVGSPTYGKGLVQKVRGFGRDLAVVKLTSSYYFTPSHRNLERTVDEAWNSGIQPDLDVELTEPETRLLHAHLASYGPPPGALAELRKWEAESGASLVRTHPPDAQLEAALALFRGERPGAWAAAPPLETAKTSETGG